MVPRDGNCLCERGTGLEDGIDVGDRRRIEVYRLCAKARAPHQKCQDQERCALL
jgi:hypothetical protein